MAQSDDEQAIRTLVDIWMRASERNDIDAVLPLMADDVIFTVVGAEPFGKEAFAAAARQMKEKGVRMQASADIQEIKVLGDWAWMRNKLTVSMTTPGGIPQQRSGYNLVILNRTSAGAWVVTREANLLSPSARPPG
jgi:uncharacterized protein (TIGR02246 family)